MILYGSSFMKLQLSLILLYILLLGCAHSPNHSSDTGQAKSSSPPGVLLASNSDLLPVKQADELNDAIHEEYKDDEHPDYADDANKKEKVKIADPIEPFNRAMYHFNDRLYFWLLKPVAQGYKAVVPEPARVGMKNFFSNLGFPGRFLSCLLQADFTGALTELGRVTVNTIWGVGGLLDPAADKKLGLRKQETDLGQTLGVYGIGHGFYIVWPFLGPSSPRDTLTIAGDYFIDPLSYIELWYAVAGIRFYDVINSTSLRLGEYESLKDAAIDPYIAMRDAYIQYRWKKIQERQIKSLLFKAGGEADAAEDLASSNK